MPWRKGEEEGLHRHHVAKPVRPHELDPRARRRAYRAAKPIDTKRLRIIRYIMERGPHLPLPCGTREMPSHLARKAFKIAEELLLNRSIQKRIEEIQVAAIEGIGKKVRVIRTFVMHGNEVLEKSGTMRIEH